ncbi:amino acid adenylation domain-containing protein [Saccharothrix tamanrassetensis]|uniref:Amino acid adenylation domain-containing protein n=1 Tax=Saccharothrix tamanrassetensis TaxID=1051531 RepID=A0A841C8E7_9PSEU|nr:non-ribosomal peptide synthetase [Saccharothrix tamanrassetensis]MBB5953679.1 amino acid adenylation domain-containing protein [Saccharothrix tamanrassetensis]
MSFVGQLSPGQVGIYLAEMAGADPSGYAVSAVYRVTGPRDDARLADQVAALVRWHPVLGSRVVTERGRFLLAPADRPVRLEVRDAGPPNRDPHDVVAGPYDLARGPLARLVLLRYSAESADLVIGAHHLVVDEASVEHIARWLLVDGVPPRPGTFGEWSADRNERAARDQAGLAELHAELREATTTLDLAWGLPDHQDGAGRVEFALDAGTWADVRSVAEAAGASWYSACLAAVGLVLSRNCAVRTPVVGATVNGRSPRHTASIGYFGNTVLIPVDAGEDLTVGRYLRRTHESGLRAYRRSHFPLPLVVGEHGGGGPQVVVVPRAELPTLDDGTTRCEPVPAPGPGAAPFPLTCYVKDRADGSMHGVLVFRRSVFGPDAVGRFAGQVRTVLTGFARDAERPLADVPTLTGPERDAVLALGRGAPVGPVKDTVVSLFALWANRFRNKTAVSEASGDLTYRELDEWSTRLAGALAEAGVARGDRVGVCLDRTAGLVVALLAVLKAGGAYVPLEPDYPAERLAFTVADAGVRVVVTDGTAVLPDVTMVDVTAQPLAPRQPVRASPEDPAYVIHTSGSTGDPKGVVVTHGNVVALIRATNREFGFGGSDVWSWSHSFAFDFSVWEVWGCLLTGGRLVVVPRYATRDPAEFHGLLVRHRVTVLSQTPSALAMLLPSSPLADLAVRLLVCGGEPLDTTALRPWFDRRPLPGRVVNMYGITETTVHCTLRDVTAADTARPEPSVGRPLDGWEVHVRDAAGHPVPVGVAGELHVAGAGVAAGYLNRPELTARRFPGGTSYRSGDLGRYRPDGELEFLGRLDDQVKIRGHRVEPGEIRAVLAGHRQVSAAAVVASGNPPRLDAYAVTGADVAELRAYLERRLPAHLLPSTVTVIRELPLTPNGKLDVHALTPAADPPAPDEEPFTGVGLTVAEVWRQVLGRDVRRTDNFFEIGGNSLLAVRVLAALHQAGHPAVALRDVFRHSTLSDLVKTIEEGAS